MTGPVPSKERDTTMYLGMDRDELRALIGERDAEIEQLQKICAAAYQLAGVVGAPVRFLDALALHADVDVEKLLPVFLHECSAAEPPAALDKGGIMQLVQEFASTWSLVGGRFDDGTMLDEANKRLEEIRAALDGIKVVGATQPPRDE
jgi:hypothetical protein